MSAELQPPELQPPETKPPETKPPETNGEVVPEDLYHEGIHKTLWVRPAEDAERILVLKIARLYPQMGDIDGISLNSSDDRVSFVATTNHGYLVLNRAIKFEDDDFPAGFVIGEEDRGMDSEWKRRMGWASRWAKDGDRSDDDDG